MSQISLRLQQMSVVVKLNWPHLIDRPLKLFVKSQNYKDISHANPSRIKANFVSNFAVLETEVGQKLIQRKGREREGRCATGKRERESRLVR